ncbi:MAG: hypothetical protein RIS76_2596 [Verrucomicrobiota bacterium]
MVACADLPQARLLTVFPPGAAAGSTQEMVVTGVDLEDAAGLLFSDPRIRSERNPSKPDAFVVTIPSEVPPGLVDVRWHGRFGVSNPRAFAVGSGPEWTLNPTNLTAATAVVLPADTVINGRMPAQQALWFRVQPAAGRRTLVRVQARELDSRLEPGLRLLDADGRELGQARQGVLELTLPPGASGLVQLRDLTFRGGDEYAFRLVLSPGPWLDFALPNVLRAGATNRVVLFGRNLEGGTKSRLNGADGHSLEQLSVDIVAPNPGETNRPPIELLRRPSASVLARESFAWSLTGTNGHSNPLLFTLSELPIVVAELTPSPADPLTPVTVPTEFCGLFPRRGRVSGVTFEAKKGDVYWIELWSDRLGFPCDPFAVVQRERSTRGDQGEIQYADVLELGDSDANPGGSDFSMVTRDPAGRFEAPETGRYRIVVRDLFHAGAGGPSFPYRLSIRRETPAFTLVALPMQPIRANDNDRAVHPLAPFLRRGGTELIRVLVFRRDGFNGDIVLDVEGLSGDLSAASSRIPAGQSVGFIPLSAGAQATGLQRPVIRGTATVGERTMERRASFGVSGPVTDSNEQAVPTRLARESLLEVSETEWVPVSFELATAAVPEVTADGKVSIPLNILRRGEFNGAFNVRLAGRSELEKSKEVSVPEKSTNATVEITLGEAKLPEGLHRVWLQGQVAGKYRNNPEALAAAEAELKSLEQALTAASATEKAPLEERKKAAEERRKAAEERAKPRDVTVRVYSRPFELKVPPVAKPEGKP